MLAKRIAGANAYPGAPKGWKPEQDGKCGHLAVRVRALADGRIDHCESAWEPTPKELAMLNAGGQVVLRVVGWQVPVALYVEPAPEDQPARKLVAVPDGWVLVPRSLPQEMRAVAHNAGWHGNIDGDHPCEEDHLVGLWERLLAAAPKPPGG